MPERNRIVIQQALYGYADGHRLLQGSIRLKRATVRELSVLTDLSGSTAGEPFEGYLTGCPLVDEGLYALSRTLAAPEMPRPGCVWTHTLLVGIRDLATLEVRQLPQLFHAPKEPGLYSSYTRPIELTKYSSDGASWQPPVSRRALLAVVGALYSDERRPVAFVADSAAETERLVLAMWAQQWSSLARTFRFCTGAIQPRRFGGELFDLQFIPRRFYRPSRWRAESLLVGDITNESARAGEWLDCAVADLQVGGATELRKFIRAIGAEFGPERSVFESVVGTFAVGERCASGRGSLSELVDAVSAAFPKREEARVLKAGLFGDSEARQMAFARTLSDAEILEAIVGCRALDSKALKVRARAASAWFRGALGWGVLRKAGAQSAGSTVARDIVGGIASTMRSGQINVARRTPGLMEKLVEMHPALLEHEESWRGTAGEQERLFEIASREEPDNAALWERAVSAMWRAGSDAVAREALVLGGRAAVWNVLARMEYDARRRKLGRPARSEWLRALRTRQGDVVAWMRGGRSSGRRLSSATWRALTAIVDPGGVEVGRVDAAVWLAALGETRVVGRGDDVGVMVLMLGLRGRGPDARTLVCRAFDGVHKALIEGKLSKELWSRLGTVLDGAPRLPSDRARVLRRTVARRCVDERWSVDLFFSLAGKRERFMLLVKTVRKVTGGPGYLAFLGDEANASATTPPKWKLKGLVGGRRKPVGTAKIDEVLL